MFLGQGKHCEALGTPDHKAGMWWLLTPGITPFSPNNENGTRTSLYGLKKKYEAREAHGPGQKVHLMADPAAVGG